MKSGKQDRPEDRFQNFKMSELRGFFLREFVHQLVLNCYTPPKVQLSEEKFGQKVLPEKKTLASFFIEPQAKMIPSMIHSFERKAPDIQNFSMPSMPPQRSEKSEPINLGKIAQILMDPAVQSIECPGSGKNILVNRSGAIQASATILSGEEILGITQEFSDKTRIPLGPGVFKAAFQDLLMTAVVSEIVGTRFIIQKRNPLQHFS